MIARTLFLRSFFRDRIFVALLTISILSFLIALLERHPSFERSPIPFQLELTFALVNVVFAFLTLKREPLLAYMFLTAVILMNGSLYFFFRYLALIQGA